MRVITAPDEEYSLENHHNFKIFLAGGITNCPNWQSEAIKLFYKEWGYKRTTLYNPRRPNFSFSKFAAEQQVVWEYEHLKSADAIVFWFAKGSVNPIVLYELGRWGTTDKIISIGCDPEYERSEDVIIQTRLACPDVVVHSKLIDVIKHLLISVYDKGLD